MYSFAKKFVLYLALFSRCERMTMSLLTIIFDCDGVLVDSEVIGAEVFRAQADEFGVSLSSREALAFIRGRKLSVWIAEFEGRCGRPLGSRFAAQHRERSADLFRKTLRPVPHIEAVIASLAAPFCVASSAPREKIELVLGLTGLLPHFEGRIFSAYDVGAWKPDPGLFLAAAAGMGAAAGRCIVVEDSLVGVQAGLAAGMPVLGYAPHDTAELLAHAGAEIFTSMLELPALIEAHGAGRPRLRSHSASPAMTH